jgi:hypothetical protein
LLFLVAATLIVCYNTFYYYYQGFAAGIFVFLLMFGGGLFVALGTPVIVHVHLWIRRRFEESTDIARDPSMLSQLLVSTLLNIVVMCVVVGLVPPSIWSAPFDELVKAIFSVETGWRWYLVWSLLVPGAAGPLTLYWIRSSRRIGRNPSAGARWLAVLQVLCYVSWFLLLLWWLLPDVAVRLGVWGIRENFWPFFFVTVIPSTLLSLVLIRELPKNLGPASRKSPAACPLDAQNSKTMRISRYNAFPSSLKQVHPRGCIPTNIAAVLRSYGIEASEQAISEAYLSTISFRNFETLGVLVQLSGILDPVGLCASKELLSRIRLQVKGDKGEFAQFGDWWNQVTSWINASGWPVMFAFKINGDSHIRTAVGCSRDLLETYDPSPFEPAGIRTIPKSQLMEWWDSRRLNKDIMAIELS